MGTRIDAFSTGHRLAAICNKWNVVSSKWNATIRASKNAPAWLYFLAKHFGEKQEFDTGVGIVEVRQFFGVQYLIYR